MYVDEPQSCSTSQDKERRTSSAYEALVGGKVLEASAMFDTNQTSRISIQFYITHDSPLHTSPYATSLRCINSVGSSWEASLS